MSTAFGSNASCALRTPAGETCLGCCFAVGSLPAAPAPSRGAGHSWPSSASSASSASSSAQRHKLAAAQSCHAASGAGLLRGASVFIPSTVRSRRLLPHSEFLGHQHFENRQNADSWKPATNSAWPVRVQAAAAAAPRARSPPQPQDDSKKPKPSARAGAEPSTEPLWLWLKKEGVDLSKLRAGVDVEGIRGLFATKDCKQGEVLLELPERLLINEESLAGTPFAPLFDEFDERVALAVFLLAERARGAASFWASYVASLPGAIESPLFWAEEDVRLLEGSRAYHDALQLRGYVDALEEGVLARARGLAPELAALQAPDLRWALSIVFTRAVRLLRWEEAPTGGEGHMWNRLSLCPALDLLNHAPADAAHTRWEVVLDGPAGERVLRLEGTAPIRSGEQVRLCYGALSSAQTLVGYGFVVERNTDEFSTVRLPPMPASDSDALREEKIDALLSLGIDWDAEGDAGEGARPGDGAGPVFAVYADGSVPEDLIAAANIAACGEAGQLEALWQDPYELKRPGARLLEEALLHRLAAFPERPPADRPAARQAAAVCEGEKAALLALLTSLAGVP